MFIEIYDKNNLKHKCIKFWQDFILWVLMLMVIVITILLISIIIYCFILFI